MEISYSPVVELPTPKDAEALSGLWRCSPQDAMARMLTEREKRIRGQAADPIRYGWRPPIWEVCWSLLDVPWVAKEIREGYRRALGFAEPVRVLLILGGNRASKTRFMLETVVRQLYAKDEARAWMFHNTAQMSIDYHHKLVWEFLPPEHRRNIKSPVEYISYNQKQGFSFHKFVLQNGSEGSFRFYTQDARDAVEGGEPDVYAADELLPAEWEETLEYRISTRNGIGIVGFTPVEGYTPTVDWFAAGARVVRTVPGFLLPKDGGPALEHLALGLSEDELAELQTALKEKRSPKHGIPWCRPEQCRAWLQGESGLPEIPKGRVFEEMPRVLACRDPRKAIVHFVSSDNPFGGALNVVNQSRLQALDEKRMRFYGLAKKNVRVRFPTFNAKVHVVPKDKIPTEGTNYQVVDPCSGRAFFMGYFRATPIGHFMFKEWPGNYYVPQIGVPGPWAEPSGSAKRLDGRPGDGQKSPNWGLIGYKKEIARIEGWREYEEWMGGAAAGATAGASAGVAGRAEAARVEAAAKTEAEIVAGWNERGPAKIRVHERFMDARFANTGSFEERGMVSLFEKFDEIGLTFLETSTGGERWTIEDGCMLIESALAYDAEKPVDFFNAPKFFVSEECVNAIFALQIYTGEDGEKGAVKDVIDVIRYYFLKNCQYVGAQAMGGGSGGRGCY